MALLRQILRSTLAKALPRRMFAVSGPARKGAVYLTFDDGPDPMHTPKVLDILAELDVKATFFVVGNRACKHPNIVRRIVADGHSLGHHSYYHSEPASVNAKNLADEVTRTRQTLEPIAGHPLTLFRPPMGSVTTSKLMKLWRQGQTVVLWNADPKDFRCTSADELSAWFKRHPLHAGDIVLLHDHVPHIASVLRDVVTEARARGLSFARIEPKQATQRDAAQFAPAELQVPVGSTAGGES